MKPSWYNIYKQSNSDYSEWWICDGNKIIGVSEGELEDHAAYVKKHATNLLCGRNNEDIQYWLSVKAQEIKEKQEIDGYLDNEEIVLEYGEKTGVVTEEEVELYFVANGNKKYQDMRDFAMQKWGWKIVRGNHIQTYYLTNQDIKKISAGIAQIFPSISEEYQFNIEVMSSKKYYTGIKNITLKNNDLREIMVGHRQLTGY